MFVHTVRKGRMQMTKPIKILGKRGRVTIPFEIRQALGFSDNDILSFTAQQDGTLLVRREKLSDDGEEAKRNTHQAVRPLGRKREQTQETEERP